MRIFELPIALTILIDFAAWFIIHMGCAILTLKLPDRFFTKEDGIYKSLDWEKSGEIWQTCFRVRAWKDKLPDGAELFRKGFPKKKLRGMDPHFLACFVRETRRAELTHWIAMPPALLFFLWNPPHVGWFMVVYGIAVNAPCIIAQRYNRTRLQRILSKAQKRRPQPAI